MTIAGFSLFVLGIIFVIVAPINKRKNRRCSQTTNGTLIDIHRRMNSRGHTGYTYVYSYFVNGIEYRINSPNRSQEANSIGDICTIWHNPKKPQDAQPFHYESGKIYTMILLGGIALVLIGIILFVIGVGTS